MYLYTLYTSNNTNHFVVIENIHLQNLSEFPKEEIQLSIDFFCINLIKCKHTLTKKCSERKDKMPMCVKFEGSIFGVDNIIKSSKPINRHFSQMKKQLYMFNL